MGKRKKRILIVLSVLIVLLLASAVAFFVVFDVANWQRLDPGRLHGLAHRLTAAWREEPSPKKGKRQLLSHLDDYDLWLGH